MHTTFVGIWLLLMGPAVGSFMTALSGRICRGQPLWVKRSSCDSCGTVIAARDLVPLFSYPLLRGRCRSCASPIPVRVWLGEIAGLALAGLAMIGADSPAESLMLWLVFMLLLGLFLCDLGCFLLPDLLTLPLALAAVGLGVLRQGPVLTISGAVIGAGAFWLLAWGYRRWRGQDGMGMGDVKMMFGLGAATGPLDLPWLTLIAAMLALAVAALRGHLNARHAQPFGCYLAAAAVLVLSFS